MRDEDKNNAHPCISRAELEKCKRAPQSETYESQLERASHAPWFVDDPLGSRRELGLRRRRSVEGAPFHIYGKGNPHCPGQTNLMERRLVGYVYDEVAMRWTDRWYAPVTQWAEMGARWLRENAQPTGDQIVYAEGHDFSLSDGVAAAEAGACHEPHFGTTLTVRFAAPGRSVEPVPYVVRVRWVGTQAKTHLYALFAARFLDKNAHLRGDLCERLFVEGDRLHRHALTAGGAYAHNAYVQNWEDCVLAKVPNIDLVKVVVRPHLYEKMHDYGCEDDPLREPEGPSGTTDRTYSLRWLVEHARGSSVDLNALLVAEGVDDASAVDVRRGTAEDRERACGPPPPIGAKGGGIRRCQIYDSTMAHTDGEFKWTLFEAAKEEAAKWRHAEREGSTVVDYNNDNSNNHDDHDYEEDIEFYADDCYDSYEERQRQAYEAAEEIEQRRQYRSFTEEEWRAHHWDVARNTAVRCDGFAHDWPTNTDCDNKPGEQRAHAIFVHAEIELNVETTDDPGTGQSGGAETRVVKGPCPDINLLYELVSRACYEEISERVARHEATFGAVSNCVTTQ